MSQNLLLLLSPGFQRPDHPADARFVCPQCNIIEGLLAAQPALSEQLQIRRVDFPRPRAEVVALVGEENQGLPLLALAADSPRPDGVRYAGSQAFLQGADAIAAYLAQHYGAYRLS
jgi:hypothetical protein